MRNLMLVAAYTILIGLAVALIDADYDFGWTVAWAPAVVGGALLGWGTGSWVSLVLAPMPIVFGLVFGEATQYTGSDPPEVWWAGVAATPFCAAVILVAVAARKFLAPPRHDRMTKSAG